jgi:3-methyl-2-oxobutanoate hydroxymethyltransferase
MGDWSPSFAKHFGEVGKAMSDAAGANVAEVKAGPFPAQGQYFES